MERFSLVWKRKMKVISAFLLLGLCAEVTGKKCNETQVEICDSARLRCICKTCISCPVGYGPSKQCGGSYLNDTAIKCVPCQPGIDFSEEYGIASCESCPQCGGRKTIRKCTPKQPSVCSDECKKGYRMNPIVEDCEPAIPGPTTVMPGKITFKKMTTPLPSLPATTLQPKSRTIHPSNTPKHVQNSSSTQRKISTTTPRNTVLHTNGKGPDHSKDNKIIILSFIGILVVASIVFYFRKKIIAHFKKAANGNQEEAIALTSKLNGTTPNGSQESFEELLPELRLKDIPRSLFLKVSTTISGRSTVLKGWKDIGEKRGLHEHDLLAIQIAGEKRGTTEGEELLIILAASQPEFLLTEFVTILNQLERKDVVEIIKDHYKNANTEQAVEIYEQDQAQSE